MVYGSGGASGELGAPTVDTSTGLVTVEVTKGGVLKEGTAATLQLSTQAAKTVTPSTSAQTAVPAGKYTTGAVKVAAANATGTYAKTGTFSLTNATASKTISGLGFCPRYILLAQRGSTFADYLQSLYASVPSNLTFSSTVQDPSVTKVGASTSSSSYEATFNKSGSVKIGIKSTASVGATDKMNGSYAYVIWGKDE